MTVRELSKLYYIKKLIDRDSLHLAELEARLQPGGMNMSSMPRSASHKNMIEELIPLIINMKDKIKSEREEYVREQVKLEEYIMSVEDYHMRLILSYRFVDMMTWQQIAQCIGGNNTEDGIKKSCYRFLKKSEEK